MSGFIFFLRKDEVSEGELDEYSDSLATCYETVNREARTIAEGGPNWRFLGFGGIQTVSGFPHTVRDRAYWVGSILSGNPLDGRLDSLDGQFAIVRVNGTGVLVATDPFGLYGLYMYEDARASYFSTSPVALALHLGLGLDEMGVNLFLRTGSIFDRRTIFKGIDRLMPGEYRTIATSGSKAGIYGVPRPDRRISSLRFRDAVPYVADAVSESLRLSLAKFEPLTVELTGGFDTRTLALLLEHAGLNFVCITDGTADGKDAAIAGQIAALKGWNWIENPPNRDADREVFTRAAVAWGGGALEAIHLGEALSFHSSSPRLGGLRVGAGAGEIARDYFWVQEMTAAGRSNKVNLDRLLRLRIIGPTDLRAFALDPTDSVREEISDSLNARLASFKHEINTFQLEILYALKNRGHYGAYLSAVAGHTSQVLPFFLRDVFTAFTSVRPRYRFQHHFQGALIQFLDERIARLDTTRGGPALPYNLGNVAQQFPYVARQGANLALRKVRSQRATIARRTGLTFPGITRGAKEPDLTAELDDWLGLIRFLFGSDFNQFESWAVSEWLTWPGFERLLRDAKSGSPLSKSQLARLATVEGASRMARGQL